MTTVSFILKSRKCASKTTKGNIWALLWRIQEPRTQAEASYEISKLCEALYNVSKQNCRTKDRLEIEFSGDNNTKRFGEPISYVSSSEAIYRREALTITIVPAISKEGVAKVSLQSQAEEKFFCSAVLSDKDALMVSYMLRCSCLVAIHKKWETEKVEFWKRKISWDSIER